MRQGLLALLRVFRDVFAWIHTEMPRLDAQLLTHQLNIGEGTRSVKQALGNFRPELEVQVKQEIHKLMDVGLLILCSS